MNKISRLLTLFINIDLFFYIWLFFKDPEIGEFCQVAGWGRDRKEKYVYDDERHLIPYKAPTDLMEVCVPIVDANDCRNNYIVNKAKKRDTDKLSDFKQNLKHQIDNVYDGINICAGSNSKDSCSVRFCIP